MRLSAVRTGPGLVARAGVGISSDAVAEQESPVAHGARAVTPSLAAAPVALPAFARYLIAGLGAFSVDFSVFAALTGGAGVDPLIAHLVSRPLGGIACFVLNRWWTFASTASGGRVASDFGRFVCVFGASLALTEGLLALFIEAIGLPALVGKALAEGLVVGFNFLALRHFAFRSRGEVR